MAWLASTIRRLEADRGRLLTLERAARVEAEAASRARDDFLAIVSHALRSPLGGAIAAHSGGLGQGATFTVRLPRAP